MQSNNNYLAFLMLFLTYCAMTNNSLAMITDLSIDQSVLIEFKTKYITSDPLSILASNWSVSSSICDWVGVTCGIRHKRVAGLNLTNMGLVGTIPPHLGNLSFLASFDISFNRFHGLLPKELSRLHRLRVFRVSDNELNGEVLSLVTNMSRLEYLFLPINNFTGEIPTEIGDLIHLRVLSLPKNKFAGRIPHTVGNLTALEKVYLDSNNFEGEIPSEMGNLVNLEKLTIVGMDRIVGSFPPAIFNISSLRVLDVIDTSLTGNVPPNICNQLRTLEWLQIFKSKFTGEIPNSIGNCTSVYKLSLSQSYMTGEIPGEIGSLPNLVQLSLGGNNFIGSIPSTIFNSSIMKWIEIEMNGLTGQLPSNMGVLLPELEVLAMPGNKLTGLLPSSILNASKLYMVELSDNSLSGFVPPTLGNLKQLKLLNLGLNNLTIGSASRCFSFFSSLSNCVELKELNLALNPLNCDLPSSMGNLSSSLEILSIAGSKITGNIPWRIGNLSSLINIDLSGNQLSGNIPRTFRQLEKLQNLGLRANNLRGQIPNEICHLQRMSQIRLQLNKFNGPIPSCLSNITSLRHLNLSSNEIGSTIPSSIFTLEDILQLSLNDNLLSGSLPPEMGNLKVLTSLDLSNNNLSGYIPSDIGRLQNLIDLSLARNGFQGNIPQSFGSMVSLETLDLSANNLVGEIPKTLESLLYLKYLNLSFNRLQGEIPDGGCFRNFTAKLFISNLALCGSPRFQVQPCKPSSSAKRSRLPQLLLKSVVPSVVALVILILVFVMLYNRCRNGRKVAQRTDDALDLPTWRRVSYYELQQATNGFSETNLLGNGSTGLVYKGTLFDGMTIAVKVFNLQFEGAYQSFETESEILANICHRNLIKIISCCSNIDFKALVLEFMPNGNLEQWLYSGDRFLNLLQRLNIMIDVASALEYLHYGYSSPLVHCDLKPSNILLDEDMVAHVGDFGLTKILTGVDSMTRTLTLATIGYMAPEFGLEGIISTKGDVYSFGIVLMETFTRMKPTNEKFEGENSLKNWAEGSLPHRVMEIVDDHLLSEAREYSAAIVDECMRATLQLAMACTRESPEDRMKMNDVLATLKKIKAKLSSAINKRRT